VLNGVNIENMLCPSWVVEDYVLPFIPSLIQLPTYRTPLLLVCAAVGVGYHWVYMYLERELERLDLLRLRAVPAESAKATQ